MKNVLRTILPLLAVVLLLAGCLRDDPTLDEPSAQSTEIVVEITSPAEGAQVQGNVVELDVEVEGVEITDEEGDTSGATGHYHVFVDEDPVATGETLSEGPNEIHFSETPVKIPGLAVGRHRLTVVLSDGSHVRLGRASDVVEVEVMGPSIDATAPEDAPLATGFTIETTVSGVQIVDPARSSGQPGTGHLDLIIDPDEEPEANGQPIPADARHLHTTGTTAEVTGLPEGDHTVWVVLTDQNHVPVSPLVADRVDVTIQ
ncbi:MAG TPA: DUF4399 domain-containing protein [Actinomycetota bacterium]|nr:DUF4399 domain-containing protein [Actinomycetota bacterium]